MPRPIFGMLEYKELDLLEKALKKEKSVENKKYIQKQIDYLKAKIKRIEEAEEYFGKM